MPVTPVSKFHSTLTVLTLPLVYFEGHIQIAQAPDRGEPHSDGEINYGYIFKLLESLQYDGFIGLEYKPTGNTNK